MRAETIRIAPASRIAAWRDTLTRHGEAFAALLFAAISVQYALAAITLAAHAPLWMDEILAVRTARLISPVAIWRALTAGAEFSPPLYDMFLGGLHSAGLSSPLALRLPSIVAVYVAALAVGAIARKRSGRIAAALAGAATLSSGLFAFAVQARPYAFVAATFALALLVTDRTEGERLSRARCALLTLLLVILIGLHFYAMLLVAMMAVIECACARTERRPVSRGVLAACAIAGASILAWWPILQAAQRLAGADAAAPGYYARPTLGAFAQSYAALSGSLMLPLAGLLIAVLVKRPERPPALRSTTLVALALLTYPVFVFAFALTVSHSYVDRYVITAALGLPLLLVVAADRLGEWKEAAALLLLAVMLLSNFARGGGEIAKQDRLDALAAVAAAPGALAIVTGDGLRFLESLENAPPGVVRRMVFLDVPNARPLDPTNRNQVLRWKAMDPTMRVADAAAFLCATHAFQLFAQPIGGGADPLPAWLAERGLSVPAPTAGATLITEQAPRC